MSKGEEERVHHRYSFKLPVDVKIGDQTATGETVNVSIGGMLIGISAPITFGSTVGLRFRIPALKEDTTVDAAVRWVSKEAVGVQFLGLRAIEVWGLNQLFKHQAG